MSPAKKDSDAEPVVGGPDVQVSSGRPNVYVTVRDGATVVFGDGDERRQYQPGEQFVVHIDQAMSLLQSGAVDVGKEAP